MPELPEVETVCRGLRKRIEGQCIVEIEVRNKAVIHSDHTPEAFAKALEDQRIEAIERRGKYIIFVLSEGWLLCHLRMTGKLLEVHAQTPMGKHVHLVVGLANGRALYYDDVRRFGGFVYTRDNPYEQSPLSKLGPEPLGENFDEAYLYEATRGRKKPVKSLLLDQGVVAGIGNIYADEVLFRAGVRPKKSASRLSHKECAALVSATKHILKEAIDAGGSTIRDYVASDGQKGDFQLAHQVYGRAGEACRVCGTTLKQVEVGGRSSVYCPKCQKS